MTHRQQRAAKAVTAAAILAAFCSTLVPQAGRSAVPPGEKLFENNTCITCHAIDHKVVGPSFEDVAKKFAGQKDAVLTPIDAIKNGHVGTWGVVPMPPHPNLPASEIKTIVDWILSLK